MPKKSNLESLLHHATERYQVGDILGAVDVLLQVASANEKWAILSLHYLYGITVNLEILFRRNSIAFEIDHISNVHNELKRWANKKKFGAPSDASAKRIQVNVKEIGTILRNSDLMSELPPLGLVERRA